MKGVGPIKVRDSGFSSLLGKQEPSRDPDRPSALEQGQGRLSELKDGVTALLAERSEDPKPCTHEKAKPVWETEWFQ